MNNLTILRVNTQRYCHFCNVSATHQVKRDSDNKIWHVCYNCKDTYHREN